MPGHNQLSARFAFGSLASARWSSVARRAAISSILLSVCACDNRDTANSPEPTPSAAVDAGLRRALAIPIQITDGKGRAPSLARYATAQSITAAAQADLRLIAQARYCWPSVRPHPTEIRYADIILASSRYAMPPKCLPEPAALRRFVERGPIRPPGPVAPLTPFMGFVRSTSYGKLEAEGCAGLVREAPSPLFKRRWKSDVRVQRTGDPTIDGAFATILADPRFVTAMGKIKVSLVDATGNVVIVRSLSEACRPGDQIACTLAKPPRTCQRNGDAEAREGLARGISNGRTGYFPYANDFSTDYPIGTEVPGFTIGDESAITGAVCLNFGRVLQGPPARKPGSPEQAAAAACLLRALGVAGTRSHFEFADISAAEFKLRIPHLVGFNENRAFVSRRAFDVLRSIYATGEKFHPPRQESH
jgi:hypothetical protein